MPEGLLGALSAGPGLDPGGVLVRLVGALVLGFLVAWIHRRARPDGDPASSFAGTLVLLAILIAMVTQVIGDNVARAFSLVGALSIVRFRTVVRDTQDTAYVIFAVVVGMAIGAADLWVAGIGIGVVAVAAFLLAPSGRQRAGEVCELSTRVALGHDTEAAISAVLNELGASRRMVGVETTRQGMSIETTWDLRLPPGASVDTLVRRLNGIDGVQGVEVRRRESAEPWS